VKQLLVHYCGWGEDWPLGQLADDGRRLLFEYAPQALAQGLELSPLHLKLRAATYGDFPPSQHRLPGLLADSLPDGWGLRLMDRVFRQHGIPHPGPLERLAFIADRAMGALRYVPPAPAKLTPPAWDLLTLAQESMRAMSADAGVTLRELAFTGGSPQGARPKALVQYDPATRQLSTSPDAPGTPWLVKFPARGEHKEVCAIEQLYAELARDCGLEMPETALFDLSPTLAAFGVARFDRDQGMRVPVHSLAGLLHVDFRIPGATDYTTFVRATRLMTRDEREVEKAYARAVFNVLFHNRDDHPKNVAWSLGHDRRWRLAPAFDLTFSDGPGGQHHMDVCGEGAAISRAHLLRLAAESGLSPDTGKRIIGSMLEQARTFNHRALTFPIRRATVQRMNTAIRTCQDRLSAA